MPDATLVIQKSIDAACKSKAITGEWASIKFEQADYPVEHLEVPRKCKLLLTSGTGAKLVHTGRGRQPLFSLSEGSLLKLENLELDYKGKDRFLFKGRTTNPDNVFLENVKISRVKSPVPPASANVPREDSVRPDQLLQFLERYIDAYRGECKRLTDDPPAGAGYPRSLVNMAYVEPRRLRAYILRDAIVIADVVEDKASESYTPDNSMEILPAKIRNVLPDGTRIEIVTPKYSLQGFVMMITLGMFNLVPAGSVAEYGRHSGLRNLTLRNDALGKERHVSLIAWYPYIERNGWHPKNAWLYAFYDIRYDIAGSIATREGAGQMYKVEGGGEIVAVPTDTIWREHDIKTRLGAKLEAFSRDVNEFEKLLNERGEPTEKSFLDYLDTHSHLLDVYASAIEPQPFLEIPEKELSTIKGEWRKPDYLARYPNSTYMLIEVERPSKPIFVGKEIQSSHELTQAINQVSTWDEIIRNFGNYLKKYPGLANHRSMVVIGRDNAKIFGSPAEFQAHLNRMNQEFNRISVITFDELANRARIAIAKIHAIQSSLG